MFLARFIIEICVGITLISCIPELLGTMIDCTRKLADVVVKGLRAIFKLDPPNKEEKKD